MIIICHQYIVLRIHVYIYIYTCTNRYIERNTGPKPSQFHCLMHLLIPGQPVADLENYMQQIQKKIQTVEKMTETISTAKDSAKNMCLIWVNSDWT